MDDSIRRWLHDPSSIPSDFAVTQDWTRERIVISRAIIRARREGAEWRPTRIAAAA